MLKSINTSVHLLKSFIKISNPTISETHQLRESSSISPSHPSLSISMSETENSIHSASQSSPNTFRSLISITPTSDDNGVVYSCSAIHPALPSVSSLRHQVILSVLYPAGQPKISGYSEGETVRVGDTLTLVCQSMGGNPLAQLVWYKNDEQVDFSYTTTANRMSANSHSFIVDASDDQASYRCVASSPTMENPMVRAIKLSVHFAPKKVSIQGENNYSCHK